MYKLFIFCLIFPTFVLSQEEKPLYEFGIFGGAFRAQHYPASDQFQDRYLAVPYMIYRGDFFKADEDGVRGEVFENKRLKLDMSLAAAFPANSEDNTARKGMDDLDWIAEFGPRLRYFIIPMEGRSYDLELALQLRMVYSTNFLNLIHRGVVFHPIIEFEQREFLHEKFRIYVRAGAIWGNEKINDYFYEVGTNDVTPERSRFNSQGGYIESHIDCGFAIDFTRRFTLFFGMQNNFYEEATNKNSPLHKARRNQGYALGLIWNVYKSDTLAKNATI